MGLWLPPDVQIDEVIICYEEPSRSGGPAQLDIWRVAKKQSEHAHPQNGMAHLEFVTPSC